MFRNRGRMPNIGLGDNEDDNNGLDFFEFYPRRYIIVYKDKNFILMEIIVVLTFVIFGFSLYLWVYKYNFNDPIAQMKKNFLTFQLATISITALGTIFITFFSKSKEGISKMLKIISIISFVIVIVTLGIKINMDRKYNEETFTQFYEQFEDKNEDPDKPKININFARIKISNVKQSYIDQSKAAYTNFKIKTTLYLILYISLTVFIYYLSKRVMHIEEKKEQMSKDDEILFDKDKHYK